MRFGFFIELLYSEPYELSHNFPILYILINIITHKIILHKYILHKTGK
jgi:hypothetical protein